MAQQRAYLRRLKIASAGAAILLLCIALAACSITVPDVTLPSTAAATTTASASASTPSGTAAATATATAVPSHADVVEVSSNIVTVGSNSSGTASASCASGNPMLGGGFIARLGGGNNGIAPTDSYPSATSTWTVNLTTQAGSIQLTAIAVCLQANFSVSMQVAQASNGGPDTTVSCPSGAVLTGGGFRSGGGANVASQPNGNGWKVSTAIPFGGSATPAAYVLCATQGLKAAATQSQSKTGINGMVVSNGASCLSGQFPVGGGYNGYQPSSDTYWRVFLNSPETGQGSISTGWMAEVLDGQFGFPTFTVYSVCATH